MKKLTVYPENSEPIVAFDETDSEDNKYKEKITSLFQVSKVSILETSSKEIFIRPGKLVAITVEDAMLPVSPEEVEPDPVEKKPTKECVQPKEPEEDIITDVD